MCATRRPMTFPAAVKIAEKLGSWDRLSCRQSICRLLYSVYHRALARTRSHVRPVLSQIFLRLQKARAVHPMRRAPQNKHQAHPVRREPLDPGAPMRISHMVPEGSRLWFRACELMSRPITGDVYTSSGSFWQNAPKPNSPIQRQGGNKSVNLLVCVGMYCYRSTLQQFY